MKILHWLQLLGISALIFSTRNQADAQSANPVTVIDLLVVYTPAARAGAGGTEAIQSQVHGALIEANLVLQTSRINARLRLARSAEITYLESGSVLTDLDRLDKPHDGYMDDVHDLRDHVAADLVCLITETGSDY